MKLVLGEVALSIASSIVYDGLKRPYKGLTDAIIRRRAVNTALQNNENKVSLPTTAEALKDLNLIIGNATGEYTEQVALLLREVEKSSLPDALRHFAICGQDPQSVFAAFSVIYDSCAPLPFSKEAIFNALNAAIKARIRETINDSGLHEIMKVQHSEVIKQIEIISASLRNFSGIRDPLSARELDSLRIKVAKNVEVTNRYVNVETTQGAKKIHIDKLVIPARLGPADSEALAGIRPRAGRSNINFINFRRGFNRAVIVGDPGGGKSTLTQYLCYVFAKQLLLEANTPGHKTFDSQDLRLPLKIVLRSLERRQKANPSYSILDYLTDEIKLSLDNDQDLARRMLIQTLSAGQAVVLFDGLDEILDVDTRRNMVVFIEQFTNTYAACPILVTSRIVGYRDAPLSEEYDVLTLARFNREEVQKFSERLIAAVGNMKRQAANQQASIFIAQTESIADDLRENPLLLGLMVYIFIIRGDIPNNRPEIYKECSHLMFEKWDQRRDIIFAFPGDFELLDLFGYLARQIFGDAQAEDGVDRDWLQKEMREFFEQWYSDKGKAVSATRLLVEFITGRAWVMCEIGPGVYKFTHRTFLEYFFARRLEEEAGSVSVLIKSNLYSHIVKGEWDVVSHLALQIATFRSGPKSIQAADTIEEILNSVQLSPREEFNIINFLSRALQYINLPELRLRALVREITTRSVKLGAFSDLNASEIIHDLLVSTRKRAELVQSEIIETVLPIVSGEASEERKFVLYLMGIRFAGFRRSLTGRLAHQEADMTWRTFSKLREDCEADQLTRAMSSVSEARSYIYLYNDRFLELYQKHGLAVFYASFSSLEPSEMAILAYRAVHLALRNAVGQVRGPLLTGNEVNASEMVSKLCSDILAGKYKGYETPVRADGSIKVVVSYLEDMFEQVAFATHSARSKAARHCTAECMIIILAILEIEGVGAPTWSLEDPLKERPRNWIMPSHTVARAVERLKDDAFHGIISQWFSRKVALCS